MTGGSVRSGRYMGEGRPEEASAMCIKTFMALAAVMLLVCGVMYLRLDDVLDILGAGGDANELRACAGNIFPRYCCSARCFR